MCVYCEELPPRARRIHPKFRLSRPAIGTTSACAENTATPAKRNNSSRNYLRVRGEYGVFVTQGKLSLELPPRARRILALAERLLGRNGTTSACAENTTLGGGGAPLSGNYLRVRGEYLTGVNINMVSVELPPRARRIRAKLAYFASCQGTTSACAENTTPIPQRSQIVRNYLRVRGEYNYII